MANGDGGVRGRDGRAAGFARAPAGRTRQGRKAESLEAMMRQCAAASAPASIGNVGVGFDILGQAFDAARDVVTAVRDDKPGVRLMQVSGLVHSLPPEPEKNTALAAANAVLAAAGAPCGMRLSIEKGVPLAAGMGGAAASAVAAAAAANALLGEPFTVEQLLPFALEGERV